MHNYIYKSIFVVRKETILMIDVVLFHGGLKGLRPIELTNAFYCVEGSESGVGP